MITNQLRNLEQELKPSIRPGTIDFCTSYYIIMSEPNKKLVRKFHVLCKARK